MAACRRAAAARRRAWRRHHDAEDRGDEGAARKYAATGIRTAPQAGQSLQDRPMKTVLVYVNTSAEVGDVDHLKVFANEDAADAWFKENDPEGVAFVYPAIGADEE
jgi:hypothetical protein